MILPQPCSKTTIVYQSVIHSPVQTTISLALPQLSCLRKPFRKLLEQYFISYVHTVRSLCHSYHCIITPSTKRASLRSPECPRCQSGFNIRRKSTIVTVASIGSDLEVVRQLLALNAFTVITNSSGIYRKAEPPFLPTSLSKSATAIQL